jgi:hypothetical protein
MHSRPQARHTERIWHISLEQIEATVSEFLGPGRVKANSREPTFSRHVSMYLARHVGGWNYPKISRFYNGRHYTTVIAAIDKIERLRKEDESVDALLEMLLHGSSKFSSGPEVISPSNLGWYLRKNRGNLARFAQDEQCLNTAQAPLLASRKIFGEHFIRSPHAGFRCGFRGSCDVEASV